MTRKKYGKIGNMRDTSIREQSDRKERKERN